MNTKAKVITSYVILGILIIGLVAFASNLYETNKASEKQARQNITAMTDSLRVEEDKNGVLVHSISILQLDKEGLKIVNDSLQKTIEEFKDSVIIIVRYKTVLRIDTIYIDTGTISIIDDRADLEFNYNDSASQLSFVANAGVDVETVNEFPDSVVLSNATLRISDLAMGAEITSAIVEEDGIKRIVLKSNNPYLTFDHVAGNMPPDDIPGFWDKFGLGVAFGPTINYDIIDKDVSVGIGITGGFVYKKIHR
jgi:hypothetical protein